MTSKVEEVARAIYESSQDTQHSWDELPDHGIVKHVARKRARAAMESMRDEDKITDEMLEAGRVALHAPENRHGAVLGAVFCAMIDAALGEEGR